MAIRKNDRSEDNIYYNYSERIQGQVADDMKKVCGWTKDKNILSWQFEKIAYKGIKKFSFYPTKECVKAFFTLNHNEEFGMGVYLDKNISNKWWLFILAVFSSNRRQELKNLLIQATWPQGYFIRYNMYLVLWLYNWKIKKKI